MSDLQFSLLLIGAVVIGAVFVYNWMQERKLRRRLGAAFSKPHEDVLFGGSADSSQQSAARVEPTINGDGPEGLAEVDAAPTEAATSVHGKQAAPLPPATMAGIDEMIDCVATLVSDAPLSPAQVSELLSAIAACGRAWRAAGFNPVSGKWEEVNRAVTAQYSQLRLALQIANRSGAISAVQLGAFYDAINTAAAKASARAQCPDAEAVLRTAHELDLFCADVDVAIGVNVLAGEGDVFPGTRVRALVEGEGFRLEPDGVFHLEDEEGRPLLTLGNRAPEPFLPEQISGMTAQGLTLLLDVPRVRLAERALQRMFEVGKSLAVTLKGRLADDNKATLTAASMDQIRQQLKDIHFAMNERGIAPGSVRALRLFS